MEAGSSETMLMDLPASLLIDILSRITEAVDLAAIVSVCRQFRDIVASIPWAIKLDAEDSRLRGRYKLHGGWHRAALAMVRRRMPLTWNVDLSGCSVLDDDVASSLGCFRNLQTLILDSCQKLTSSVLDALAVSVRSGPRAASLQRCFRIGPAPAGNLLAAAAADGSRLQCILLSHLDRLDLPRESPYLEEVTELDGFDKLGKSIHGYGLRILALHNCGGLGTLELATVGATCPLVELLLLGGSVEGLSLASAESLSTERVVAATTAIVNMVQSLQRLQVLELTFFTEPVIHAIREELVQIEIWDFCEKGSLAAALCFLRTGATKHEQKLKNWEVIRESVALALRAAANCCSVIRRRTPLHWAADQGDVESASCLVQLGAATAGMDSSGASPVFLAAEYGHASVCKALLEGGGDPFAKNRAGENPIYIAALKGHCDALEVMLSICALRGWNWQDRVLYCDGWTPLMAAAVADRQDVGRVLLLAIGYKFNSANVVGSRASSSFLDAQNRHGQTAMHIAARRASVWFITNLLAAGASVDIPDEYGDRALNIAINYQHSSVIEILKQWDTQHATPSVVSDRRKSSRVGAPTLKQMSTKKIWRPKAEQQVASSSRNGC